MTLPEILQKPLTLPVIASPLFLASGPELVHAQCQAGVIGAFPALNARPASLLSDWLDELQDKLAGNPNAAPFAVNQIVHRSNDRLEQDMQVIVDHKVPIVITSLGARPEINEAVHSYGGIVLHDVTTNRFAHKAIEKGADGLIAVAAGAGGHAGAQSPFALIREIRAWFDGPLALSGAITHGRSILAAQALGADFAYIGSAFLATKESNAPEPQKQLMLESTAEDIVYSNLFTGVHGNYLRGSIVASGLDPDNLGQSSPAAMSFGSDRKAKAWRDIWGSGQGIAMLTEQVTTQELVDRLKAEYDLAREEVVRLLAL
ncbi:MAG TPA: nitronate monooxygenase family protein [Microbacteriaceae bacterium]|jgi:nitronate monooxygenase|nr:nitronate monooxygenase family protein [Microbacteriaceae bacterium]